MSAKFRLGHTLALILAIGGSLAGWATPASAGVPPGASYFTVDPCRVLDTRPGNLTSGVALPIQFKGVCNVPTEASAAAISITAVNPSNIGFLTFYPTGTSAPEVSYLNFNSGQTRSGSVIVLLSEAGSVDALPFVSAGGNVELIVDVFGYFVENLPPVADNDSYGPISEGGTLNEPAATGVLNGDTDADGDPLTAVLVTGPAHASSFTLHPDGSFDYTHDGSETTTDSFTYTANDGTSNSNVATVTLSISGVNDAPVADDDGPYSVNEGGTLNEPAATGVLNGDTDAEGTPLTAVLDVGPLHASSFTLNADGSFTYTHDGSETTSDSFTYHAFDGSLPSNIATVTISIAAVNDAPVADDDGPYSVNEGGTLNEPAATGVLTGDTDAEGTPLTAVLDVGPLHASSFTLNADGSFTYTHDGSETTSDSFTYHAFDGSLPSNIATVTISITPVNDAPVADNDGPYSVNEGGTLNEPAATGVLTGDTDAEGTPLTAVLDVGPLHASSFTLNADGSFSYTHDGSETTTDSFTYHAFDGSLPSNVATVTISIAPVNDPPTADNDAYNVNEGATLSVPAATGVLFGDFDAEGTPLTAVLDVGPLHASSFTLNADGSFTYTHDGGETTTDSFTYHAFDGALGSNIATVTITIAPVNDVPALDLDADDSGGTTGNNYAIAFADGDAPKFIEDTADATIADVDSPNLSTLKVTLTNLLDPTFEVLDVDLTGANAAFSKTYDPTTDPSKGVLTITASPTRPIAEFNALLRKVTYVNTDDNLDTTSRIIEFVANDGAADSNTATTTVTMSAVNDPPTADNDGPYSVNEGATLTVPAATGVLNGDLDPEGATLTAVLNVGPLHASSFTLNADGSFSYTHDGSETTSDTFTYHAFDGSLSSNIATVTITINAVNDPPTADNDGPYSVNEGATLSVPAATGVLNGDLDPEATPLTAVLNVGPLHASSFTLNADGSFSYTHDGSETTSDTFTYHAFDGALSSNIATVTITVNPVNDPPTADDDGPYSVNEGASLSVPAATGVLNGDLDAEGTPLTAVLNVGPLHASSFTLNADGSFSYTHDGSETTSDTFTYHAFDGALSSNIATVTITVNPVNDAPTADNDGPYSVNEGASLSVPAATGVLNGDLDAEGTPLTAVLNVGPLHASSFTLNADGSFSYTHDGSETTSDTFTYHAFDGALSSNIATVTITVNPVNDPPVANPDTADITEEAPNVPAVNTVSGNVLTNDTDPDSSLTVSAVAGGSVGSPRAGTYGSVTINSNGSYTYTLDDTNPTVNALAPGQMLTDAFGYTASDSLLTSSSTLTVTIHGADDPATPDNDAWDFIGNTQIEVDRDTAATPEVLATTPAIPAALGVLDGDIDPDGGPAITISGITGCADLSAPFDCVLAGQGTVSLQADGSLSFIPEPGDADATASFQYTLTGNPNPATVTFTRFERVWYVNPGAGAGNGTSASPFNSLDSLDGGADSDVAGDYIFVHNGTLALSGPMPMENNQHLIGEGHVAVSTPSNFALSIPVSLNGNPSPTNLVATGTRPQLTNANGDTIRVTTEIPIEIVGLSLAGGNVGCGGAGPTSCNAIDLSSAAALTGSSTLTVRNNDFRGAGTAAQTNGEGIDVNLNAGTTGTLTLNVTNNTWNAAGTHVGNAVDINRAAGTLRLDFSNNTGILSTATAVNINGGAAASTTITGFANNTIHQNTAGNGIVITNVNFDSDLGTANLQTVSGGTSLIGAPGDGVGLAGLGISASSGELSFTDLDVYTTAGAAISVTGTGAFTGAAGTSLKVGSGVATIDATGGPAVGVSNATIDLQLASLKSTNSASTGVSLDTVTGTLSAPNVSSITNATGTDFNINASTAAVTYDGTITDDVGQLVAVSNSGGSLKSFTGAITDGDDGDGGGISLTGNSSTIRFSGGVVLSTGANPAFAATGGGTVEVCDENPCNPAATGLNVNKITTTTGTALNVANTMIGANHLEFRSIAAGTAASGPTNGILLNNTGTAGGLKVKGTGSAGSGGTIQRTTGTGVSLTDTGKVGLNYMVVQNSGDDGIFGLRVVDFALDSTSVLTNGNSTLDEGLEFGNPSGNESGVSGTVSITNCTFSANSHNNFKLRNGAGNLASFTVSNSSFNDMAALPNGANSFIFETTNTATVTTATVSGSTFANNGNGVAAGSDYRAFQVTAHGDTVTGNSSTISDFTVSGNTFTNNGLHAAFEVDTAANLQFKMINNLNMIGASPSHAIHVGVSSQTTGGTLQGRIQGNTIGNAAVAGSGSTAGAGINVLVQGRTQATLLIDNNVIRQTHQAHGINVESRGPTISGQPLSQSDVTVTNNNVVPNDITGFPAAAIYVVADSQGGSPVRLRADIRSNTVPAGAAVDLYPSYLIFDEVAAAAEAQLVDTAPASATCDAQLDSTNTGSATAGSGCALIAGPISTPP